MAFDEIVVSLKIMSEEISAREINEYLGITCDDSQVRGEMNRLGTKRYPRHGWFLESNHVIAPNEYIGDKIEIEVKDMLSRLAPVAQKIMKLSRAHEVEFSMYFLARDVPPMHLSKADLAAIAGLGACLDIDLILYANPEPDNA